MDFLKKNWAKLAIAILMVLAALVYIVALIISDAPVHIFKQSAGTVAALVFFFGITAYLICKMLNQKWAKWILLGVGIVATVFGIAFLIYSFGEYSKVVDAYKAGNEILSGLGMPTNKIPSVFEWLAGGVVIGAGTPPAVNVVAHAFTFLVVFGLIPLVKGIKKVVTREEK